MGTSSATHKERFSCGVPDPLQLRCLSEKAVPCATKAAGGLPMLSRDGAEGDQLTCSQILVCTDQTMRPSPRLQLLDTHCRHITR